MAEEIRTHCEKGCGKPFKRLGKWYTNHIAKCDGTKKWKEGTRADRPERSRLSRPAKKPSALDETIRELEHRRGDLDRELECVESTVAHLKAHRSAIDAAVEKLKEAKKE